MSEQLCNKIYFFDIDETLLNTHKFNKVAIDIVFDFIIESEISISKLELSDFYFEIYEEIKSHPNKMSSFILKLSQKYFSKFSGIEQVKKLESICDDKYKKFIITNMCNFLCPRVYDCLSKLKKNGFNLGIISQGNLKIQRKKFENLGICDFFNKELLFFYEKKTNENYKKIYDDVIKKNEKSELYMVGDREDLDIIMSRDAGFLPIRIIGSGKYSSISKFSDYLSFKNFEEFYQSL